MKFVAMRFWLLTLTVLVLTSCTRTIDVPHVDQGCALYTGVKSVIVGVVHAAEKWVNGGEEIVADGDDEIQKPVTKQLKYKNQEGVVEVVMKVDEKGNWKVVNMAATNEELAKYVLTKLKDYNQASHKAIGQVVKYRFVFKKQV